MLKLVLDTKNTVGVGDRPIFGVNVTIKESVLNTLGKPIGKGEVIGWVDYIDVNQFGCFTNDQHYTCASDFLHTEQNQLIVNKPIVIHTLDYNMNNSKALFSFSPA